MHLVPYLKSQIIPNDEMNKITLPSRHKIQNSSSGGLRPSTLSLSQERSSVPHNTYEWSLRGSGKESFVSLKPECQSGGRSRDLPTFQADRFITTASAPNASPPRPRPNCFNWESTNSKGRLAKKCLSKNNRNNSKSCIVSSVKEAIQQIFHIDLTLRWEHTIHMQLCLSTSKDHSYMLPIYGSRQSCHQVVPDFSNWE